MIRSLSLMAGEAGEYFGNVGDLKAGTLSAIYLAVFIGGITFTVDKTSILMLNA